MHIRPSVVRKAGMTYRYYQPVRSVRRNGKIVQETVAHLGKLDARGRAQARALADHICGSRTAQQRALFEAEPDLPQIARSRAFASTSCAWSARAASATSGSG